MSASPQKTLTTGGACSECQLAPEGAILVATRVVPTIYPKDLNEVCNMEQGQDKSNFVPRSLARPQPVNIPQATGMAVGYGAHKTEVQRL